MHTGGLLTKRVTAANQESGYIWRVSLRSQGLRNQRSHVAAVVTGRLRWRGCPRSIWASLTRCAEQRGRFSFILFQYGRFGPLQQMVYTKPWGWNYMASQKCALIQVCDITKVCTGPRVRYYKSVHWSKCVHQSFWNLDISMRYTDSGIWTSSIVDDYDHTGPAWYDTIRRVYSDLQRALPFYTQREKLCASRPHLRGLIYISRMVGDAICSVAYM